MTPSNYTRIFKQPHTSTLLRLLDELVSGDQSRNISAHIESDINISLLASPKGNSLSSDHWKIQCEIDMMDNTGFAPKFDLEDDPIQIPLRAIMRCLSMPPRRKYDQLMSGLSSVQQAVELHQSITVDANERAIKIDDLEIATFIVGLEQHVIKHARACVNSFDVEDNEAELEEIEATMSEFVAKKTAAFGISPITLSFNRDPRGATVILGHSKTVEELASVEATHRGISMRLVKNLIRERQEVWTSTPNQYHSSLVKAPNASDMDTPKPAKRSKATVTPAPTGGITSDISPDVLEILRAGSWGNARDAQVFKLPDAQLDRALYDRVAKSITLANGKWSVSKKGFVFKEGADKFSQLLETGATVDAKRFDFFPTSEILAKEAVAEADLKPGMMVLEPEAGHGAIADAAAEIVGKDNVTCYEFLPENVAKLTEKGYRAIQADFLAVPPNPIYDRIIMNPPFGGQADMKHVEHAAKFLKPDGILISIMSPSFQTRTSKQADSFRELMEFAGEKVRDIESGAFKESGTNVETVMVRLDASLMPWNQVEKEEDGSAIWAEVFRG